MAPGLPSRDFVAVLHDRRVDFVDSSGADGGCYPQASGPAFVPVDEVRMAEKLSRESVAVRVMYQTVEIAAQPLLENSEHEYPPEVHSRTSLPAVRIGKETGCHQHLQPGPEFPVRDEGANAPENFRNVVPRPGIDVDAFGRNLAEFRPLRAKLSGHVLLLQVPRNLPDRATRAHVPESSYPYIGDSYR